MNILTLEKITKIYTQRKLFDEASFYMQDDEKVGIVGINGTGKSTLLKICAGIEEPDSGNVTRASDQVIGYLPQHPEFEKDNRSMNGAGKPAEGDAKAHLENGGSANSNRTGRTGGRRGK